jgi:hypothetical protein
VGSSLLNFQVIMAWYHTFNKKVNSGNSDAIEKAFNQMMKNIPSVPKIMHVDQFYSKKYFNMCVKPTVEVKWALVKDNVPTHHIKFSNSITHCIYNSDHETEAFKQWLEVKQQEAHVNDMAEYQTQLKELHNPPDSAQSFHK